MWKLLMGMRACGLKNDALMETFYEIVGEHYQADEDYAIYVFMTDMTFRRRDWIIYVRENPKECMNTFCV